MSPSQITPLDEATAYHLNDTKASQIDALNAARLLVEELPFAATDMQIIRIRRQFRFEWGVRLDVLRSDAALLPQVAALLGGELRTKVERIGHGAVTRYELLTGELHGVPFEISAFMGTQLVAVA
jgi:hypothetical protein